MESNKRRACNFPLCTYTVRSPAELAKHISSHMNKNSLFPCPALGCSYTTPTKRGLLIHWHKHARKATLSTGTLRNGDRNAARHRASAPLRSSRESGSSNDADSDNSSSLSHSSGIPWQGRVWPHDFLEIMEQSAALNSTTGGCYYLDTPDGRKNVPAHLLLYELYEQHVVRDNRWLMKPEEEMEWTLQSEALRLESNFSTLEPEVGIPVHTTGREGCLCGEWMVELGYWNKEDLPFPTVFTNGDY